MSVEAIPKMENLTVPTLPERTMKSTVDEIRQRFDADVERLRRERGATG